MIVEMIKSAQSGDQLAMEALIQKFQLLLNKYSNLLDGEDSKSDLTVDFLILVNNLSLEHLKSPSDGCCWVYFSSDKICIHKAISKA